ncbi:MAG: hypothetical protein IIC69_01820 [Nanoarchaeota archaeon]|nr:hypothetical protein [Nanoarchaeota archaeon]
MAKAKPYRTIETEGAKRTLAIVDYDSQFTGGIERKVEDFNKAHPDKAYRVETHKATDLESLAQLNADKVIHTGGQGDPVPGTAPGSLYICHSHQFKAEQEGGKVERLADYQKGTGYMDVKEDDPVIGKQGQTSIEKYHTLAVTEAPKNAKVIATSKQTLENGEETEIAEAIRYVDGSISVQGHPGGDTPSSIIDNYLDIDQEYKEAA